jgi:hypothetical protein
VDRRGTKDEREMTHFTHNIDDTRIAQALDELRELIRGQYPTAAFTVAQGDDPEGIYLTVQVDVVDIDEVVDVFIGRLIDMQVDDDLPIYVIPVEPRTHVTTGHPHLARAHAFTASTTAAS